MRDQIAVLADRIDEFMQTEEVRVNGWTARQIAELAGHELELLSEVAMSGVEFEDERIKYVTIQVDRDSWFAIQELHNA